MTALLVLVTLVSLALAGALLAYVLRLTRQERDRSEARAAVLAALLDEEPGSRERDAAVPGAHDSTRLQPASTEPQTSREWHATERLPAGAAADDLPLVVEDAHAALARAPIFGGPADDGTSARSRLLLVPAIGVLIVGLALAGVYAWNTPGAPRGGKTDAAETAAAPLELVSLRHQRKNGSLVVAGLVRNPRAGGMVKGLSAVALSFDREGTFLTSNQTSLDFPQLAPGEESPFAITLTPAASIARYRVSFRTGPDVVPHLDRRTEQAALLKVTAR